MRAAFSRIRHMTKRIALTKFCLALAALPGMARAENPNRIRPLADGYVEVCRSPDPQNVYCYTPGIGASQMAPSTSAATRHRTMD